MIMNCRRYEDSIKSDINGSNCECLENGSDLSVDITFPNYPELPNARIVNIGDLASLQTDDYSKVFLITFDASNHPQNVSGIGISEDNPLRLHLRWIVKTNDIQEKNAAYIQSLPFFWAQGQS